MQTSFTDSFMCDVHTLRLNTMLVVTFVISFLLFKFFLNKERIKTPEENARVKKKAEKYLNKYRLENEEFFMAG